MSLLVVGSFALDTIKMPDGKVHTDVLGGSGVYFSLAAAKVTGGVGVVGAVGDDFPARHAAMLRRSGIDMEGLAVVPGGKTFRWSGTYQPNMDDRETDRLEFGVLGSHRPVVPEAGRRASHVFLACAVPSLQLDILKQMKGRPLAVCDTIEVYIKNDLADLKKVLAACDGVVINNAEARLLLGDENMVRCAKALCRMGPRFAVVKKGANGAVLAVGAGGKEGVFPVPAWPLEEVADPTGAGDCFAGGLMGWLAKKGRRDAATLRQGLLRATAVASVACGGVGPARLARARPADIEARARAFAKMLGGG